MTLRRRWGYYGFRPLTIGEILFFGGFTLLVGFVEETVYRGLILRTMLIKGTAVAAIVSSALFAITHLLNALSGQSMAETVLQIFYALLVGCSLALLWVKNRNILPLIAFHFIHNLIQFLSVDRESIPADIVILVILAAQCAWLVVSMRKPSAASAMPPVAAGGRTP
ncbi:hypothetical protein CDO73_09580 [Saccharibacillus sp. O23]|nr:hypothetical protein CDO73_09580 [Saccharibacillus sp. O23]